MDEDFRFAKGDGEPGGEMVEISPGV